MIARPERHSETARADDATVSSPYRIDFALITLTGNLTRYLTTKPIAEADPSVVTRWYPLRTWVPGDWLGFLPGELRVRARSILDSLGLFISPPPEALILHALDTYPIYALFRRLTRRKTIIIENPDGGIRHRDSGLRGVLYRNAIASTALFVPWSSWGAAHMKRWYPQIPAERIHVLHPGIDLTQWTMRPPTTPGERFRLLFVGSNPLLKGADTLLDAFDSGLSEHCDLDLATQSGFLPEDFKARILSTPHVRLHLDLTPGSPELRELYQTSDSFVLPTNKDLSPWVALEALAAGIPVIISPVGGIPDVVRDGETGLHIPSKDSAAIVHAVERLRTDEPFRRRLIAQGRAHIEAHYDAHKNTQQLLGMAKALIDARRKDRRARV